MAATPHASWPDLPYGAWKDTCATLHLWTQIVGKIRLAQTPWLNHSWHVPLYVGTRGLTTSPIPYGTRRFEIAFDFIDHALTVTTDDGEERTIRLEPQSVAEFHAALLAILTQLGMPVRISDRPSEIADAIPFSQDRLHAAYDAEFVHRFWRVLVQVDRVFAQFRTGFLGKCSPVHFFWGSFDLAVTRFSGRRAPPHPGGAPNLSDEVVRKAYSHEVSSAGFWPGGGGVEDATFYSYAYPEPPGFRQAAVRPAAATFSEPLGEFLLPYDTVRQSPDPDAALLAFLDSTYAAAAKAGQWDRAALECAPGRPLVPRPVG